MDLIDRQALLKQIDIDSDGEPGYYGDTWKFIDTIKSMPSATDTNVGTKLGTDLAEVGTDCISRQQAIDAVEFGITYAKKINKETGEVTVLFEESNAELEKAIDRIKQLPSAEEESFEWCTDCKEYDQEAHCCHRFSKMIRKTVDEMQIVRCKDCKYAEYIDDVQTLWCTECGQGRTVAPYDFCSYGERREDG